MRHAFSFTSSKTPLAKLVDTLVGVFFLVISIFILFPLAKDGCKGLRYLAWDKTPCTVSSIASSNADRSYRVAISYTYYVDGVEFSSSKFSPLEDAFSCSKISKKNKVMEKYRQGASTICYVNPDSPSEAVLDRDVAGAILPMVFFLFFFGIAISAIVSPWRRPKRKKSGVRDEDDGDECDVADGDFTGQDEEKSKRRSAVDYIPVIVGALFTGVGIFIFVQMSAQTFKLSGELGTTEGTVIASRLERRSSGKHGSRSSPYIAYKYEVDGVTYENDTYSVGAVLSSASSGACAIVKRNRPGAKVTVHYDIEEPQNSALVVNEKKSFADYVIFIFPLLFIVAGGGVLIAAIKQFIGKSARNGKARSFSGMHLKRVHDVEGKFLFTFFWCAFVLMFTTIWFTKGRVPFSWTSSYWTFDKFFVLIFPVIGVFLIISCIKSLVISSTTGHYDVEISSADLRPGAQLQVHYSFSRQNPGHKKLTFIISEQATRRAVSGYSRNSVHYYHKEYECDVYKTENQASIVQGSFSCTIPQSHEGHFSTWRLVAQYGRKKDTFKLPVGT